MARLDVLPAESIIRGFKGILDFYLWRGLPCVRAWPRYRPARQTDASKAAALLFGAIIKAYSLLGDVPLEAYRADAADHNRTARDIMVSGVYGNLHEASMSDFLTLLTQCRDFLSNLQALLNALDSLSLDELDVNVESSVLPPGAATAAAQATQLTALQKIDDLQDALQSKALDRLLVRGMDQVFSFRSVLATTRGATISGAGGFVDSLPCAAGEIWIVTAASAYDQTSATTRQLYCHRHVGTNYVLAEWTEAMPALKEGFHRGWTPLVENDTIRVYFIGALAGDICSVTTSGYIMTLET